MLIITLTTRQHFWPMVLYICGIVFYSVERGLLLMSCVQEEFWLSWSEWTSFPDLHVYTTALCLARLKVFWLNVLLLLPPPASAQWYLAFFNHFTSFKNKQHSSSLIFSKKPEQKVVIMCDMSLKYIGQSLTRFSTSQSFHVIYLFSWLIHDEITSELDTHLLGTIPSLRLCHKLITLVILSIHPSLITWCHCSEKIIMGYKAVGSKEF